MQYDDTFVDDAAESDTIDRIISKKNEMRSVR